MQRGMEHGQGDSTHQTVCYLEIVGVRKYTQPEQQRLVVCVKSKAKYSRVDSGLKASNEHSVYQPYPAVIYVNASVILQDPPNLPRPTSTSTLPSITFRQPKPTPP